MTTDIRDIINESLHDTVDRVNKLERKIDSLTAENKRLNIDLVLCKSRNIGKASEADITNKELDEL